MELPAFFATHPSRTHRVTIKSTPASHRLPGKVDEDGRSRVPADAKENANACCHLFEADVTAGIVPVAHATGRGSVVPSGLKRGTSTVNFGGICDIINLGESPPTHEAEFARIVAVSSGVVIVEYSASGNLT